MLTPRNDHVHGGVGRIIGRPLELFAIRTTLALLVLLLAARADPSSPGT
jgi:hypothetical protein